jgi:hypothetical protein
MARYAVRDQAIVLNGYTQLTQALQRIEGRGNFGADYEMQRRLRTVGETVAKAAPQFVTHTTGRHGSQGNPHLEDSVKVSVTARSASVYSTAEHGGVQNVGGGPKTGWAARGPHVKRDRASKWMIRAVASEQEFIREEMDGLVDWVVEEFERR